MCFGGGESPSIQAAPTVAPTPSPSPGEESASKTQDAKNRQLKAIKFGIASTQKSDLTNSSLSLLTPQAMGAGLKAKTGQ